MDNYETFHVPENGEEQIQIGHTEFEFIEDKCQYRANSVLGIWLVAQITGDGEEGIQELMLESSNEGESELGLQLRLNNICNKGVPTGELIFSDGSTGDSHQMVFGSSGFGQPVLFNGKVTLRDGWVGIDGIFKPSRKESPSWQIKASKKLALEQLVWTKYSYTLTEAEGMSPELVTSLYIDDFEGTEFPQQALRYKGLTSLRLCNKYSNRDGVTELPVAIGELRQLTNLVIQNTAIIYLPSKIFKLPDLRYLSLDSNKLEKIPADIELPMLQSADFSNNRLTSLPESLALQPRLSRLSLNGNPWQTLPEELENLETLNLSISDKRRFFDYTYLGADGNGTVDWNNTLFLARGNTQLKTALHGAVKNTALEKHTAALEKIALASVCINTTVADDYTELGNTRFGGMPDLPVGIKYPLIPDHYGSVNKTHYVFIAQLNCEALAPCQDYLPRHGILYFYIADEEDILSKVIYVEDTSSLWSARTIDVDKLNFCDTVEPYNPFKVECRPMVGLPSFYSDNYWYELAGAPELKELEGVSICDPDAPVPERSDSFSDALGKKGVYREHNDCYYASEHHSINDYVSTQNESPQEMAANERKGNPEDWVVLLKVTSDQNCGFRFFNAGEFFFVIHKSDLAKKDFSSVFTRIGRQLVIS